MRIITILTSIVMTIFILSTGFGAWEKELNTNVNIKFARLKPIIPTIGNAVQPQLPKANESTAVKLPESSLDISIGGKASNSNAETSGSGSAVAPQVTDTSGIKTDGTKIDSGNLGLENKEFPTGSSVIKPQNPTETAPCNDKDASGVQEIGKTMNNASGSEKTPDSPAKPNENMSGSNGSYNSTQSKTTPEKSSLPSDIKGDSHKNADSDQEKSSTSVSGSQNKDTVTDKSQTDTKEGKN